MGIGDRIRERRTELGWSRRELAEKMSYNYSTIGRIETGKVNILYKRKDGKFGLIDLVY